MKNLSSLSKAIILACISAGAAALAPVLGWLLPSLGIVWSIAMPAVAVAAAGGAIWYVQSLNHVMATIAKT